MNYELRIKIRMTSSQINSSLFTLRSSLNLTSLFVLHLPSSSLFTLNASAYILICLTIASRPFERVGER